MLMNRQIKPESLRKSIKYRENKQNYIQRVTLAVRHQDYLLYHSATYAISVTFQSQTSPLMNYSYKDASECTSVLYSCSYIKYLN